MRSISVAEAEQRFASLLEAVRDGAPVSVHDQGAPVARVTAPPPRDHGRELAFLALKRQLDRNPDRARPRLWTRTALYRDRSAR